MNVRFRVEHRNVYGYETSVGLNFGHAHLLPRATPNQQVLASHLHLDPAADEYRERLDAYGNRTAWFYLHRPHRRLEVTARSQIRREAATLPEDSPPWDEVAAMLLAPTAGEGVRAREFCLTSPFVPMLPEAAAYARASFSPGRPLLEATADLTARIHADFDYRPSATQIDTPLSEVLAERHGVCQDFAHLGLAGLRALGLAARYVSGWLETTPPPGQPRQLGADASHAWIAVYLPGAGWFDFDPTNGIACGIGHLTLAWGRDYADVTPLKGVIYGGGPHTLEVGVTVERLDAEGHG